MVARITAMPEMPAPPTPTRWTTRGSSRARAPLSATVRTLGVRLHEVGHPFGGVEMRGAVHGIGHGGQAVGVGNEAVDLVNDPLRRALGVRYDDRRADG